MWSIIFLQHNKKKRMLSVLIGLALTASMTTVQAANMPDRPNAGTALESTKRVENSPTPAPVPDKVPLKVEEPLRPPLNDSSKIKIPASCSFSSASRMDAFLLKIIWS